MKKISGFSLSAFHITAVLTSLTTMIALAIAVFSFSACKSGPLKKTPPDLAKVHTDDSPPGVQSVAARELDGRAFTLDGKSAPVHALTAPGDNRKPLFIDNNRLAFTSRRLGLERWQVYEIDMHKAMERRLTFDAGDAEPLSLVRGRILIASSGESRKASERVLKEFKDRFATEKSPLPIAQQFLLVQSGTETRGFSWNRVGAENGERWSVSLDTAGQQGVALAFDKNVQAFKVAVNKSGTVSLAPMKVDLPKEISPDRAIASARIFPDSSRIAWSNGEKVWTTKSNGREAEALGDNSLPAAQDLAIDPSSQWLVFSTPSDNRGMNLMAIHRTGKCLRPITELPGDERDPTFSPDGKMLAFAEKQGDIHLVATMPFASAPCTP